MRARRTPNDSLRARLEEAQWNGAELARALNAAGGQAGIPVSCDRSNVSHWLSGTRPRPAARELLLRVFSKRLGRVVTPAELGLATGANGTALAAGPGAGGHGAPGGATAPLTGDGCGDGFGGTPGGFGTGYGFSTYEGQAAPAYDGRGEQRPQGHHPHLPHQGREPETTRERAWGRCGWSGPGGEDTAAVPGAEPRQGARPPVEMTRTGGLRGTPARPARSAALRELADLVQEHRDPRRLRRLRELPYRGPGTDLPGGGGPWRSGSGGPRPPGGDGFRRTPAGPVPTPGGRVPTPRVGEPAGSVLTAALAVFERQGGAAARQLVLAELSGAARVKAARLCRMLGRAWADELAHGAAQRALSLSRSLAAEAGDPVTEAMALRDMSVLCLDVGRPADALALAEAAVGTGWDRAGAGTRAFLLTQRAVALAVSGDGCAAAKDMDGAEYWIDGGEDDEHGPYPFGALLYQRARMHRAEGDRRRAVSALELSLALRPPAEQRSRALIRIELAHLHLSAGEYAAAAEEMRMLTPTHESLRSARVDAALAHLRGRALSPERVRG